MLNSVEMYIKLVFIITNIKPYRVLNLLSIVKTYPCTE